MNFIERIRQEVSLNDGKVLKTTIITDLTKRLEVKFFVNLNTYQINYKDIFIKDIVSLGRNDNWTKDKHTWKELINDWITGYGWKDEVINYFENEIEDKIYFELKTPKTLDELVNITKIMPHNLLSLLTELEIKGLIKSISGGKYART